MPKFFIGLFIDDIKPRRLVKNMKKLGKREKNVIFKKFLKIEFLAQPPVQYQRQNQDGQINLNLGKLKR
jgi:hypothetical protein